MRMRQHEAARNSGLVMYSSLHVFWIGYSKDTAKFVQLMPRGTLELFFFLLRGALGQLTVLHSSVDVFPFVERNLLQAIFKLP